MIKIVDLEPHAELSIQRQLRLRLALALALARLVGFSGYRVIGLCGTHAASCYTLGDLKSHLCYARRPTIIEHCLQHSTHGVSHYVSNTLCSQHQILVAILNELQHSAHYILHYSHDIALRRVRHSWLSSAMTPNRQHHQITTLRCSSFCMFLLTHREAQYHDKVQPPPHIHSLQIHSALKFYTHSLKLRSRDILM